MLADFYIPRLSNDMKIAVQKNHLVDQLLYRSLVHFKKNGVIAKNQRTFKDALRQNMVIFSMVFSNTMTPGGYNFPHAVTIYKEDRNKFVIKNTYLNRKTIELDSRIPTYQEFRQNQFTFCRNVRKIDQNFSNDDFILLHTGFALRFKDKAP